MKRIIATLCCVLCVGCTSVKEFTVKDENGKERKVTVVGTTPQPFAPSVTMVYDRGELVHATDGRSAVDQLAGPAAFAGGMALIRPSRTTNNNSSGASATASAVSEGGGALAGGGITPPPSGPGGLYDPKCLQ